MKRVLLSAAMGMAITAGPCGTAQCAPAGEECWEALFDGKTLDGWRSLGGKARYEVHEATIVGTAVPKTENSFLATTRTFADFILEFEFKVDPRLNSGVQIRSQSLPDYKKGRVHGYQVEIDPNPERARWWTAGLYDEARRGWLCPAKDDADAGRKFTEQGARLFRPDQWNRVRVEADGDRIRTWLNGELRADLTDSMTPRGFIALQVHGVKDEAAGATVRWRNIRIREISR